MKLFTLTLDLERAKQFNKAVKPLDEVQPAVLRYSEGLEVERSELDVI